MLRPDLLIVGAGPAGMSAAIVAARAGLKVVVVDEQPTPGGQIWRGIEANAGRPAAGRWGSSTAPVWRQSGRFVNVGRFTGRPLGSGRSSPLWGHMLLVPGGHVWSPHVWF